MLNGAMQLKKTIHCSRKVGGTREGDRTTKSSVIFRKKAGVNFQNKRPLA